MHHGHADCHHGPSRRHVLAMLSAAGASGVGLRYAFAQADEWMIDTHHHIYPPRYVSANLQRLMADTRTLPATAYTSWSPKTALEQMDKANVRTAIVSMTSPGIWWNNNEEARTWARECNEFGAGMAHDYPGRFGMFAAIPLPDTDGSLRETAYALDTLKLDGIGLLTSYAGKPLGDPSFGPVFEELNRRKVAVFVHPTMSCCGMAIHGVDAPTIDFPMDTTRTITSLAFGGAFARYPDIKFIFSHGGGTMPMIVQRFGSVGRNFTPEEMKQSLPDGFEAMVKRQYYDIASVAMNPGGMAAVLNLIPTSQLFYGSDAPFGSTTVIADRLAKFALPPGDIKAIRRENALRLFPRYAA